MPAAASIAANPMRTANVFREGRGEFERWIEARLSDAHEVRDHGNPPFEVDAADAPPSEPDGVLQLDFFSACPVAVRSTPDRVATDATSAPDLDGSRGAFRRARSECLLQATNDYEAIAAWVRTKTASDVGTHSSPHTGRAYLREAERLLLWAIIERRKPLSSLTHEECLDYMAFLADPAPASRWCGPRNVRRWSPTWRPFEGALSAAARRQSVVILNNLFGFLHAKGYLAGNAMAGIRSPRGSEPKIDTGRSFTGRQWSAVETALAQLPSSSEVQRLRFVVRFLYGTGLRLSEVVEAGLDDFEELEPSWSGGKCEKGAWLLRVRGKGGRTREVPVPSGLMAELSAYLIARGLHPDVRHRRNRQARLLGRLARGADKNQECMARDEGSLPQSPLATSTLYKFLKKFFIGVSARLRADGTGIDPDYFERASTHWLRHSHASHAIASGVPLEIVQQGLGHRSLATTTVYVRTERDRRALAMESFWARASARKEADA